MTESRAVTVLLAGVYAVLIAAGGALAAGSALSQGAPPKHDQVERGRMLYAEHCSHCHGFNMVSAGDVTFDLRQFPHDQEQLFLETVINGKSGGMPPWGDMMSVEQVEDIWAYVLTGGKE